MTLTCLAAVLCGSLGAAVVVPALITTCRRQIRYWRVRAFLKRVRHL